MIAKDMATCTITVIPISITTTTKIVEILTTITVGITTTLHSEVVIITTVIIVIISRTNAQKVTSTITITPIIMVAIIILIILVCMTTTLIIIITTTTTHATLHDVVLYGVILDQMSNVMKETNLHTNIFSLTTMLPKYYHIAWQGKVNLQEILFYFCKFELLYSFTSLFKHLFHVLPFFLFLLFSRGAMIYIQLLAHRLNLGSAGK